MSLVNYSPHALNAVRFILHYAVELPLLALYLNGPQLNGFGFWEGLSLAEICARLTGVESRMWDSNMDMCQDLVQRKFGAFLISCYFAMYVVVMLTVLQVSLKSCWRRATRCGNKKMSLQ